MVEVIVAVESVNAVYESADGSIEGRVVKAGVRWAVETRSVGGCWEVDCYNASAMDACEVLEEILNSY